MKVILKDVSFQHRKQAVRASGLFVELSRVRWGLMLYIDFGFARCGLAGVFYFFLFFFFFFFFTLTGRFVGLVVFVFSL